MLGINESADSTYIEWRNIKRFFGGIALFKTKLSKKQVYRRNNNTKDKIKK